MLATMHLPVTIVTEPQDIEMIFDRISPVMMALRLAMLVALRTLVWPNQFAISYGVSYSVSRAIFIPSIQLPVFPHLISALFS